uniref:ARAD1C22814p n=1 Tax=Blastobotrys adeninivorans TaxID=409370 RepID=A0A060T266_BLAAD
MREDDVPSSPVNPPSRDDAQKFAQLSSSLKTRLSFAFLKVQNGWTDQSIDELESEWPPPKVNPPKATFPATPQHRRTNSDSRAVRPTPRLRPMRSKPTLTASQSLDQIALSPPSTSPAKVTKSTPEKRRPLSVNVPNEPHSPTPSGAPGPSGPLGGSGSSGSSTHGDRENQLPPLNPPLTPPLQPRLGLRSSEEEDAVDTLMFLSSPRGSQTTHFEREQ